MSITALFYGFISIFILAILVAIQAAIFPVQFYLGFLIFFPLQLFTIYISIVLFLILTNSYLGGALLGWIVTGFSGMFLQSDQILDNLGFQSTFTHTLIDTLGYIIPSSAAVQQITNQIFTSGFSSFDWGLLGYALVTVLPFGLLSYYLFLNKEF